MPRLAITLATRDYDFVTPLATGDVAVDGLDLTILRTFEALQRVADPASTAGRPRSAAMSSASPPATGRWWGSRSS